MGYSEDDKLDSEEKKDYYKYRRCMYSEDDNDGVDGDAEEEDKINDSDSDCNI